jgi:hypothetical protein
VEYDFPDMAKGDRANLERLLRSAYVNQQALLLSAGNKTMAAKNPLAHKSQKALSEILVEDLPLLGAGMVLTVVLSSVTPQYAIVINLSVAAFILSLSLGARYFNSYVGYRKFLYKALLIFSICAPLFVIWILVPKPELARISIELKDSPYATRAREARLDRDFNGVRYFFEGLKIKTTSDIPPISISDTDGVSLTESPGLPNNRKTISIGKKLLDVPQSCTRGYIDFLLDRLFFPTSRLTGILGHSYNPRPGNIASFAKQTGMEQIFVTYFNDSFWGEPSSVESGPLWAIRGVLGDVFTDRLVTAMLKTTLDSPEEGNNLQLNDYFAYKLKIAFSIVSSDQEKWGKIQEILRKYNMTAD